MPTLDSVTIDSVDIKAVVTKFTIDHKINGCPKCVITALKGPCDALNVFAVNDTVTIQADFSSASNLIIFDGLVRKIETSGLNYVITCYPYTQKLWEYPHSATYTSQDHDVSMGGCITSPGFTSFDNHYYSQSIGSITFKDEYPAYCLNKLARFSPEQDSATAQATGWWCCSTKDSDIVYIQSMGYWGSGTTLSHSNGRLLGKLQHLNSADDLINRVITNHAGGRHSSNDTDNFDVASSVTKYGTRAKILYLPNISTNADAIFIEDNYLAMYYTERTHFKVPCKFDALMYANSSYYNFICDAYTVTDDYNGVTYTNVPLIGYSMEYPSWKCVAEFGVPPHDLQTMLTENRTNEHVYMRDSSGYGCSFKAYRSTTQSIASLTDTKLQFQSEIWDTGGNYDNATNYRFTPPVAGYYFFHAQSDCTLPDTYRCDLYLRVTGNNKFMDSVINNQGTTMSFLLQCTGHVKLATTDYVEVFIYQTSTGSMNVTGNEYTTNFSGTLIATY